MKKIIVLNLVKEYINQKIIYKNSLKLVNEFLFTKKELYKVQFLNN